MKRQRELDILRLVCFFQVAALHVNSAVWSGLTLWSTRWLAATALRCTWAVPVFVMLSGRFFLDPERDISSGLLGKKILRLLAAMLFWGVVYQLYYLSRDFANFNWKRFAAGVVTGAYHMWFLWMLLGLYILTPLLRRIAEDGRLTAYYLLLHTAAQTAWYFGVPIVGNPLKAVLENLGMEPVLGYSGYFLLGCFLHRREFSRRREGWIYAAGFGSWMISLVGNLAVTAKTGVISEFFTNYRSPLVMLQAGAVFVFFEKRMGKLRWKSWMEKLLEFTAAHGFGAYLCHALVNEYAVALVGKERLAAAPLIWIPLTTCLVAAGSFCLAAWLRKLPKIGKWVA